MAAILVVFGVIFVAEFGDKSQLMVLAFAARYSAGIVLAGISIAAAAVFAIAVGVGSLLGVALPDGPIAIAAGVLFLVFAVWTLGGHGDAEAERAPRTRSALAAVALSFFLAELGDKTMIATLALAAREDPLWTWLGATLGLIAADVGAIVAGRILGVRLPERLLRRLAAAAFLVFGIVLLIDGIRRVT